MPKTFRGGTHPAGNKHLASGKTIRAAGVPPNVFIPLSQHTGKPCEPLVRAGDQVKTGQLIGRVDAFVSAPIHSSVTGTVKKIDTYFHPVTGTGPAIEIETASSGDTILNSTAKKEELSIVSPQALIDIIKNAGIAGLGGAAFPTHVKLSPPPEKKVDTVILNGAECEPYLACDYRLMMERGKEIILGLDIILRILGVENSYIGIEDNKKEAVEAMRNAVTACCLLKSACCNTKVITLHTKYPQGAEKQLIKSITGRVVPSGGLPFDIGAVVCNVGTAFAIYEAVYFGKPLYERLVTVTGSIVREPANLLARIGTPIRYLIEQCGGLADEPGKVIAGGPMMGIAQYSLDAPIIKGTSGILVLSKQEARLLKELPCIRCGRCADYCPVSLMPADIMRIVKAEKYGLLAPYDPKNCMECGVCAYECPSKIPLVDYLKFAKTKI